jgi:hypothetical protein
MRTSTTSRPFLDALKSASELVTTLPEFVSFTSYHSPKVSGDLDEVGTWNASVEWALKTHIPESNNNTGY